MLIENTKQNRAVQSVVATMAIENMYLSKEFVNELIKVANGEKSSEELRQEVIKNMPAFNMRGYVQYIKEKGLDPEEMSMDIMNKMLGNRIRVLRNARNLTQEQVAGQIGMSRQKYAGIENGVTKNTHLITRWAFCLCRKCFNIQFLNFGIQFLIILRLQVCPRLSHASHNALTASLH